MPSSFFIGSNETIADLIMSPEVLMRSNPEYYGPRFDAIKDIRDMDDGSLYRGSEFRRVASFVNVPLALAIKNILDPEFLKSKRRFYGFLDRHPEYLTYDRRKEHKRSDLVTFVDGKEV